MGHIIFNPPSFLTEIYEITIDISILFGSYHSHHEQQDFIHALRTPLPLRPWLPPDAVPLDPFLRPRLSAPQAPPQSLPSRPATAPAFRDFDSFDEDGKIVDDVAAIGIAGIHQGICAGE